MNYEYKIMMNGQNNLQNGTYCMIPFIRHVQNQRQRVDEWPPRTGEVGEQGTEDNTYEVSF